MPNSTSVQNIVICFDGTSNQFGTNNTNVVRLVQALNRDVQRLYYDAGIGTLPDARLITRIGKTISEVVDLAFATSLERKVEAAYRYLMNFWERDARVFIFGFSRGAYTARVLAGMLHSLGLLSRGNESLVPYVMRLFASNRGRSGEPQDSSYWRLSNGFRTTFARQTDNEARHFRVHFLGLWDTVSSVGWVWDPRSYPFTATNPSVVIARHAVSIDEHRAFFRQNTLNIRDVAAEQDWKEVWFPGYHCDIGGGYRKEQGRLWLVAFDWMVHEAAQYGLVVDAARLEHVRNCDGPAPAQPWTEPANESLTGLWQIAEYYPKRHWNEVTETYGYHCNLGRPRSIRDGALIHESALRRLQAGNYRPPNFSPAFIQTVQTLNPVPEVLAFTGG
jgi:uncharacterized protein (DUF2235 family)